MSLFGTHSGVVEEISLQPAKTPVSRREILSWERELIGLYVSDHPLSPVMRDLADVVTHYSGQLSEAAHQEVVRVAGIVTRLRPHQTKAGKSMAFVALEDLQGTIELVVFPRTWDKFSSLLEIDRIVLVDGKVDAQGGEPKVLVDNVTVEFTKKVSVEPPQNGEVQTTTVGNPQRFSRQTIEIQPATNFAPELPQTLSGSVPTADPKKDDEDPQSMDDLPPEPDMPPWEQEWRLEKTIPTPNPPDWDEIAIPEEELDIHHLRIPTIPGSPLLEPVQPISEEPGSLPQVVSVQPDGDSQPQEQTISAQPTPVVVNPPTRRPASTETVSDRPIGLPPYLISPTPPLEQDGEIRMVTVVLRSSGDKTRDVLRLRRIHGILMSYPGEDRFALQVYERGRFFLLEFPNFSCGICQDLLDRLAQLVGRENLRVETLRYQ
jgi:DNA polymerase-3 subunit alpha